MDWGQSDNPFVGLVPVRDPAHADPEWFQCDLYDEVDDPDAPFVDPLPTERHRSVPEA